MRSKIASRAKGHSLEKRFLDLDLTQLTLLYNQALKEEKEESEEKFNLINAVNKVWMKNFEVLSENMQVFINPKMYKQVQEYKELMKHREELNEDNFEEEWAKLMEVVPEEYIVEEPTRDYSDLPKIDDDIDEMISGWVSSRQSMKDGEE